MELQDTVVYILCTERNALAMQYKIDNALLIKLSY